MSIIRQDYGSIGIDVQTQMLIAPVLAEMKADRQFAVGDQFIVDSVLYKITTAISVIGTQLVVGTNCALADTVTEQINDAITPVDISDSFISSAVFNIYQAYKIGKLVTFSVYLNPISIGAKGALVLPLMTNNAPVAKNGTAIYVAVSLLQEDSTLPTLNGVLDNAGQLVLRNPSTTGVTNRQYWLSATYVTR